MRDPKTQNKERISSVLLNLSKSHKQKRITYDEILIALGRRAFGIGMVLFALPSALPLSAIPGFSFIFSLPIAFFALQLLIGEKTAWLPKRLANKDISMDKLNHVIQSALPYLLKIEHLLKPRWDFFSSWAMLRLHGFVLICLVTLLLFPIPLSNFIFATLIILFGMGLSEKDGIVLAIAYGIALLYLLFLLTIGWFLVNEF